MVQLARERCLPRPLGLAGRPPGLAGFLAFDPEVTAHLVGRDVDVPIERRMAANAKACAAL